MEADSERVLYEGRSAAADSHICVTERWCVVDGSPYAMDELTLLGVTRGSRRTPPAPKMAGMIAVAGAVVFTVVAISSGWTAELWPAVAVAVAGTAAITMLPAVLTTALRRPYEIWAEYHGVDVRLFVTADPEQYGQVARALVRAREAQGP